MSALARLLEQATPGPWTRSLEAWEAVRGSSIPLREQDARLIALASDMARLLIDHRAWFETATWARYVEGSGWFCRWCSLDKSLGHADGCEAGHFLARFAELEQRAAP